MYLLLLLLLLQTMNVQLSNAAAGHTACSDVAARFAAFSRAVCLRRDVKHNFTGRCTLHDCLHIAPMPSRKGHRLGIWLVSVDTDTTNTTQYRRITDVSRTICIGLNNFEYFGMFM